MKPVFSKSVAAVILGLLGAVAFGQDSSLRIDVAGTRSIDEVYGRTDGAVRLFSHNAALLTRASRSVRARAQQYRSDIPFSLPVSVRLTSNGEVISGGRGRGSGGPLNLIFDGTGSRAFAADYQARLQGVLNSARPFMDAVFGQPSVGGDVHVRNYDADIGDRDALAGGYYLQNGPDGPEIRFPVYSNSEAASVNFLHCLLLAYLGPNAYGFDAFEEGLVRGAVLRIARTPSALPAADQGLVQAVLSNSYDVGAFYDWNNGRALGAPSFIARNLRSTNLPSGGSTGGLYLLRYQMSGSAWQKVLAEYPNFAAAFNSSFYANPGIASNRSALVALGQSVLNSLRPGNPTVEGLSFAEWSARQYILDTRTTAGPKLHVSPVPITSGLAGTDFGVFDFEVNYFQSSATGDETLQSGTSFPIYWEGDLNLNRFFPSAQDSRVDIAGGFGSVTPNLPDQTGGVPYRATLDFPVADQLFRLYLPAGAIATTAHPAENDFFGTVVGASLSSNDTLRLVVSVNGSAIADVPVTNNAFGAAIGTQAFLSTAQLVVKVVRKRAGVDAVLLTRTVDKGPGPLALDLRINGEATQSFAAGIARGVSLIGIAVEPFTTDDQEALGNPASGALLARYNSSRARYELFPDVEPFARGHAYFVRLDSANGPFGIAGRSTQNVDVSVALKPGWNMVTTPVMEAVSTTNLRVVKGAEFPQTFAEASGKDIGADFFSFNPGSPDPASGAPEGGTMVKATVFEPGKGYFVRVLAPEGVTLVFTPGASSTPVRQLQKAGAWSAAALPVTAWLMGIQVTAGEDSAVAYVGGSNSASRAFDPKEDSGMPPTFGGLQVVVEGPEDLFRDMRRRGIAETYPFRIQGLRANAPYTLSFPLVQGKPTSFMLYNERGLLIGKYITGAKFNFRAKGSGEHFSVRVTAL